MLYRYQYADASERESLIQQNSSLHLIEEQNIIEGNFLVFSDTPRPLEPIYVDGTLAKFNELQDNQLILMDVLGAMFEAMLVKGTV